MPNLITTVAAKALDRPLIFIGCDPGVNGGVAVLISGATFTLRTPDAPKPLREFLATFQKPAIACVELVTGWVGGYNREGGEEEQARTNPGSSMLQLGRRLGWIEMALASCSISVEYVGANVWQRELGIAPRAKGSTTTEWKNLLKAEAQRRFPGVKVTKAISDALLIAEYCRRKYGG